MQKEKRLGFFDGTTLKLIAMLSMVFDHVGDNFFPDQIWMRVIGKIAMPIFAFFVAEGFSHTHDKRRYLLRMGLFALVSEIPFDLVTAGKVLEFSHQNIMASFFWAILALLCFEHLTAEGTPKWKHVLAWFVLAVAALAAIPLGLDFNLLGVGLVFLFYLLREKALWIRALAGMVWHALLRNVGIYWFGLLGFAFLFFYNGKRGRGLKWLFYLFYPGHLLLIYLIKCLLA